jgi:hypothetical protein
MVGQFVNNNAALTYLSLLPVLAPVTLNGMAYAIKEADLTRLGVFTPLVSPAAELAQPLHTVHGTLWRTIRWRSRRFHVVDDTDFRAV